VDRDDIPDGGSSHIASTIKLLKERTNGKLLVEVGHMLLHVDPQETYTLCRLPI